MIFANSICWIYFLIIIILPLVSLFLFLSSHYIGTIFSDKTFLISIFNSLTIASATTLFSVIIGVISGFIIARVKIIFQKTFLILLTLPLFFVPYQSALAWSTILPTGKISHLLFSKIGVIFILTGSFYPIILWLSYIAFSSIPPEEEESALLISSPAKVIFKISFLKIIPYILTGALLIFLFSFSEPGVATYLGINIVPYEIITQFSAFYNMYAAFSAAIPMAGVGFILFILQYIVIKKGFTFHQRLSTERVLIFEETILKYIGISFISLIIIIFLLIPLGTLLYESFNIKSISIALTDGIHSLLHSLIYSLTAGFLTAIWALVTVYLNKKYAKLLFSTTTLFTFFISPPVIALGIIYLWSHLSHSVYNSVLALIFGLLARFSFLSYKIIESAFDNLDPSAKEAALISGIKWYKLLFKIIFPQIKKWFFLGVMLVFIFSMNELGASILLYPPGGEPLVVRLYTLSVNNPVGVSSVLALMNSITTIIFILIFIWLSNKKNIRAGQNYG